MIQAYLAMHRAKKGLPPVNEEEDYAVLTPKRAPPMLAAASLGASAPSSPATTMARTAPGMSTNSPMSSGSPMSAAANAATIFVPNASPAAAPTIIVPSSLPPVSSAVVTHTWPAAVNTVATPPRQPMPRTSLSETI